MGGISILLINCLACGAKISAEAKSCIHCGHPIKSRKNYSGLLPFILLLMLLVAGLGAVFQLNPAIDPKTFFGLSEEPEVVSQDIEVQRLSPSQLQKELRAYAIRVNRLTPYKPNHSYASHLDI